MSLSKDKCCDCNPSSKLDQTANKLAILAAKCACHEMLIVELRRELLIPWPGQVEQTYFDQDTNNMFIDRLH